MSYDRKSQNEKLFERILDFSSNVIILCKKLPQTPINKPLISQVVRSASSIGANYSEACAAESSKDFVHKIKIVAKESRETHFFLRLIYRANPIFSTFITPLGQEASEFVKIFSTIISKFRN